MTKFSQKYAVIALMEPIKEVVDSLLIIDLFPTGNGERRKILKTLRLNG